nr:hypothetical protein [Tanacetum cinerariifolium]
MKKPGFIAASMVAASATSVVKTNKSSQSDHGGSCQHDEDKKTGCCSEKFAPRLTNLRNRIMEDLVSMMRIRKQVVAQKNLHQDGFMLCISPNGEVMPALFLFHDRIEYDGLSPQIIIYTQQLFKRFCFTNNTHINLSQFFVFFDETFTISSSTLKNYKISKSSILSCPHHDKTKARQEARALPGTCGGVVAGALLATKMVIAAKALATEWVSKPKPGRL